MYLMQKNGSIYESQDLETLSSYFDIEITPAGKVFFEGKKDTITYNIEDFSRNEMFNHFIHHRFIKLAKEKGAKIYKADLL